VTEDQLARIVNNIVQTWPSGPRARIWTAALRALDAADAFAVYAQLRDTLTRTALVGDFLALYNARRSRAEPRPDPTLDLDAPRVPGDVGWSIGDGSYRQRHGRGVGDAVEPDPDRMVELIERHGTRVKDAYAWHYRDLVVELHDDHKLAQASLAAVAGRLRWMSNGTLMLTDAP
jgi:hypothetical protein